MSEAIRRILQENMHSAQLLALVAPCLSPWQRTFIAKRMEQEAEAIKHRLLYGDPRSTARPVGFTQATSAARPEVRTYSARPFVVFDEVADFDKGRHALALRKLHKKNVTSAILSAPI